MEIAGPHKDEFITSLAALALYDGDAEITSDQIAALIAATNNTVQPYWPALFASNLRNNIEKIIFARGAGSAPVASATVSSSAGDAGPAPAAAKAPEKPKEEVVDALEGGMDMFGGGGGGGDY